MRGSTRLQAEAAAGEISAETGGAFLKCQCRERIDEYLVQRTAKGNRRDTRALHATR